MKRTFLMSLLRLDKRKSLFKPLKKARSFWFRVIFINANRIKSLKWFLSASGCEWCKQCVSLFTLSSVIDAGRKGPKMDLWRKPWYCQNIKSDVGNQMGVFVTLLFTRERRYNESTLSPGWKGLKDVLCWVQKPYIVRYGKNPLWQQQYNSFFEIYHNTFWGFSASSRSRRKWRSQRRINGFEFFAKSTFYRTHKPPRKYVNDDDVHAERVFGQNYLVNLLNTWASLSHNWHSNNNCAEHKKQSTSLVACLFTANNFFLSFLSF